MRRHPHRITMRAAAALALLTALAACSSDQMSRSVGAAMRSWCQNAPEHCSLADNR